MDNQLRNTSVCDECGSDYYSGTSQMSNLCSECSNILYGYEKCKHIFKNGRCIKCFWNGKVSDYVQKFKENNLNKCEE